MNMLGMAQKWAKEYVHVNEIARGSALVEKDGKHGYVNRMAKLLFRKVDPAVEKSCSNKRHEYL